MIIVQERRKKNISEYIIYMFQVEDVLRALELNEKKIEEYVNHTFKAYPKELDAIKNWYLGLNDLMKEEQLRKKGHLSILKNNIKELEDFHNKLINNPDYSAYLEQYNAAKPFINEFGQRSNASNESDIMICMQAIYSKFLLKLKSVEISQETEMAFVSISNFLALLSVYFTDYETGKIEI